MDNKSYVPASGRVIGEDGKVYNIVDLLGGGTPVSDRVYNIDSFSPASGRVIGEDGKVYNLVDLLSNSKGDVSALQQELTAVKDDLSDFKNYAEDELGSLDKGLGNEASEREDADAELQEQINEKIDKSVLTAILNNNPTVETLDEFLELQRTDKVYQVKIPKSTANPTTECEKLGANAGLICEPSTDTLEGQDDYAGLIEFAWWHNNYVRDEDGYAVVIALEGDSNFATTGSVDVGSCGMSFYYKWDETPEDHVMLTWSPSPHPELGLIPFSANVPGHSYWCLSAYPSVVASDGLLRSQPGGKVARNQSYSNVITNYAKKGAGYTGAGAERNTLQIIFTLLKYGTKNSQSVFAGVTNWNVQYTAAVQRDTAETYFPVTASQANNLEVGLCVSVGYGSNNNGSVNQDRDVSTMHAYANDVKILKIEDMEDGNKAVYLDIDTGFTTTPVALTEELSAPIVMSSMHIYTGDTDSVVGKHDGSAVSNTSGRHSYRVQGVEYALGGYLLAADTVMMFKEDYSKDVYIAPKGVAHSTNTTTIQDTYTFIGNIPASANGNGGDWWVGDISIDPTTGCWHPAVEVSGSTQGHCDKVYAGGTATSGIREYLQGGVLGYGSEAGSASLSCWLVLSRASWLFCGCD